MAEWGLCYQRRREDFMKARPSAESSGRANSLAPMSYEVQTPVFEGPFDLLLHLILQEKVDLYEISLAAIVEAYLRELDGMDGLDLELTTEFVMIAATLVELKAKRLLPNEADLDLDDELALWAERDLLLSRLLECKTFKDAAKVLQQRSAEASKSYPRVAGLEERFYSVAPDLLEGVDVEDLQRAYVRATTPKPVLTVDTHHIHAVRLSVAEAVEELIDELPRAGRITFRELTSSFVNRLEIVVRFLALLELYKQGMVDLLQAAAFGEIQILWLGGVGGYAMADLDAIDVYDG
jgi:segregation and condensation protein A